MKDSWLTHNTDKILLFILTCIFVAVTVHVIHHDPNDMQAFEWASGAFSTVLGALVMILTGSARTNSPNNSTTTTTTIQPTLPTQPTQPPDLSGKLKVNVP